jgi:hypothetical protein
VVQPVPTALATLATLALFAGALLPLNAATRTLRMRDLLRMCGAAVSDFSERVVPVTRRRLRPRAGAPTWPALLPYPIDAGSEEERAAAVRRLVDAQPDEPAGHILATIAREEDGELRMLAFRSLISNRHPAGREVFCEALRSGSDAERSLAIDGLARLSAFDELTEAFSDRIEPLAAKAVLLFAASRDRRTVVEALDDRVDPARRDGILKLLAGVLDE